MKRVLISGGGIAGLTLGILLKKAGFSPYIIERAKKVRADGYMIDFFGTGWDVAERMGIDTELKKIVYPIDSVHFVNDDGTPYCSLSIRKFKIAFKGKYNYLLRSDLEKVLLLEAQKNKIDIHFDTTIESLVENKNHVRVRFSDESEENFDIVVGADGIHSRVRELIFGPEKNFSHYLGYYVAAFHAPNTYGIGQKLMIQQSTYRTATFYPLSKNLMDAAYIFKSPDKGFIPREERKKFLLEHYKNAGWIIPEVVRDLPVDAPMLLDSLTQIKMPRWSRGRVVLIGDACGCLTLIAGQGAQMAMGDAYVLARELERHGENYKKAFSAYESFVRPHVEEKQKGAERFAKYYFSLPKFLAPLRKALIKIVFSKLLIISTLRALGSKSILQKYPTE